MTTDRERDREYVKLSTRKLVSICMHRLIPSCISSYLIKSIKQSYLGKAPSAHVLPFFSLSLSLTPLLLSFRAYRRYYDRNGNSTYGSLFFRVLSVKREKMSTRMLLVLLVRCLDIMYIQKVMFSLVTMIMIFSYCIHIHIYECACVCLCAGVWLSCQHKKKPHNI